jgi:hypothetical protein
MTDIIKKARTEIQDQFLMAEKAAIDHQPPMVEQFLLEDMDLVFMSQTQAYREVLLGCILVRVIDKDKDIHLPYVKMGEMAFSGRSLDERVVNPFLHEKRIPCSRGPYLSVFRRQVRFDKATREGVKDQKGYDAFLRLLDWAAGETSQEKLFGFLDYLLYRFVLLREAAQISLIRLDRVSLSQYKYLIHGLLNRQSGGIFPVILVLAMIEAIVSRFVLDWQVEHQGINVSDKASGVGGDIIVKESGKDVIAIEVTERPVDVPRVIATFTEKIAPLNIPDYIFAVHISQIEEQARQQVEKYFTQGYEVIFIDISEWLANTLVTVGNQGRRIFQERIIYHLSKENMPKSLKVAWNEEITRLIG